MRLALAGRLRFEEIWIDGACRASLYGICSGERYCYYLSGYDPAWSKYSLGAAVVGLSIAGAVERGAKFYDMLRGAEPYKFEWANEARATFAVQVASNSLPARLAFMCDATAEAARAAAQILLPSSALALWRRWRQARIRRSMLDADGKDLTVNKEEYVDKINELAASILLSMICL